MHNDHYIKSSPHFFRLIGWTAAVWCLLLCLLATLLPAPLQEPANPAMVPNPVKAGWFLLWIQEVVSWSKYWIYPLLATAVWLVALPWLGKAPVIERAAWWPRQRRLTNLLFLLLVLAVLLLTIMALWFRGANWGMVRPWQ